MAPSNVSASDLFKDIPFLGTLAVALILVSVASWFAFGNGPADGPKKPFTHMHCPECREETLFSPRFAGKRCESCGKGAYQPTVGSIFSDELEEGSGGGRIILFGITLVVALQGAFFVAIRRLNTLRSKAEDEINRTLITRCPYCRRKVAYPIKKIGTFRTCTQCKTSFELPADGEAEPAGIPSRF
jgi:ribosomal protein S27E